MGDVTLSFIYKYDVKKLLCLLINIFMSLFDSLPFSTFGYELVVHVIINTNHN